MIRLNIENRLGSAHRVGTEKKLGSAHKAGTENKPGRAHRAGVTGVTPAESPSILRAPIWILPVLVLVLLAGGCIRYSFTGGSIPSDVRTIHIPFFADQSNSGVGDLSDRLYQNLVDRFVNQSRLSLGGGRETSDAWLEGVITSYSNRPYTVTGNAQSSLNQVQISVRASFQYADATTPVWSTSVSGAATYDVLNNPVDGEQEAIEEALEQIANTMFTNSVSQW